MRIKLYSYIAAVLIILGAFWGVYRIGGDSCREAYATAAREHMESQNRLLAQIEDAKQSREVIFRDKTRIVERITDNCTDVPLPDSIRMQLSGGSEAKPIANP